MIVNDHGLYTETTLLLARSRFQPPLYTNDMAIECIVKYRRRKVGFELARCLLKLPV